MSRLAHLASEPEGARFRRLGKEAVFLLDLMQNWVSRLAARAALLRGTGMSECGKAAPGEGCQICDNYADTKDCRQMGNLETVCALLRQIVDSLRRKITR